MFKQKFFRLVSDKELIKIEHGKISVITRDANVVKKKIRPPSVPYKSIFMDKVVWGILISALGGQIGFLVFVLFGPTYLNKVSTTEGHALTRSWYLQK